MGDQRAKRNEDKGQGVSPAREMPPPDDVSTVSLLRELVAHLRKNRTQLREEWARRITAAKLLGAMTKEEIFTEATSVYDNYVEVLETGAVEALQAYARDLSERIIPRGVETDDVIGIVLLLRDVLARSLFAKYQTDFQLLNRILDAYEPAANRIANTVAVGFVQERERIIRQQQEAIRELSTPVLQVRERLLILPIIGVIDSQRARQLTEQLLRGIRANRARVVVIDITGVAAMDSSVANHLVLTVEASRLLGAAVIVTGLSPEIAQTLVRIGVNLGKMHTVGDLQGGIEEAERVLGYRVVPIPESSELGEIVAKALRRDLERVATHGRKGDTGERPPAQIGFHAIRGGDIVGEHTVIFAGTGERVELTVRSQSRMTYAAGALRAAKWLKDRPAGLYDMFHVLGLS